MIVTDKWKYPDYTVCDKYWVRARLVQTWWVVGPSYFCGIFLIWIEIVGDWLMDF